MAGSGRRRSTLVQLQGNTTLRDWLAYKVSCRADLLRPWPVLTGLFVAR
jgi:hypothetical protein